MIANLCIGQKKIAKALQILLSNQETLHPYLSHLSVPVFFSPLFFHLRSAVSLESHKMAKSVAGALVPRITTSDIVSNNEIRPYRVAGTQRRNQCRSSLLILVLRATFACKQLFASVGFYLAARQVYYILNLNLENFDVQSLSRQCIIFHSVPLTEDIWWY